MARRGRSNTSARSRETLDSLLSPVSIGPAVEPDLSPVLSDVEDGRVWHPDPDRGALTIGGRFASVVVHSRPVIARSKPIWSWKGLPVGVQVPVGVRFESPLKVVTCLRRKIRRNVIFALDKGGKGSGKRQPRRTWRSDIKC